MLDYSAVGHYNRHMSPKKILLVSLLIALMFVGGFGVFHFGMDMDMDGGMSGCPSVGMAAMCEMNPLEHISAWQGAFTTLPYTNTLTLLIISLLALFFSLVWIGRIPIRLPLAPVRPVRYTRRGEKPVIHLFQELFSSGILNPKLF